MNDRPFIPLDVHRRVRRLAFLRGVIAGVASFIAADMLVRLLNWWLA